MLKAFQEPELKTPADWGPNPRPEASIKIQPKYREKNEPDVKTDTTDYKKLYDELKTTSDKLQSDLTALQAQNKNANIASNTKKETLTDIFKNIL